MESKNKEPKMEASLTTLGLSLVSGALSVIICVFSAASTFLFVNRGDTTHFNYDVNIANTGLLSLEGVFSLLFMIIAVLFLCRREFAEKTPRFIRFTGGLRIFLLVLLIYSFWDDGWRYILDIDGGTSESLFVVFFGFLQGIFIFNGVKEKKEEVKEKMIEKPREEPEKPVK